MRSLMALGAAGLAGLAAVMARVDGDGDIVPFFVGLAILGLVGSWATREPLGPRQRLLAQGIGLAWLGAAGCIGIVLLMYQATCGCSYPGPVAADATYLGLTATAYHLAGVYVGGTLMAVAAFSRALDR